MEDIFYTQKAKQIRRKCLELVKECGKGHLGGTFSIIDVLVVLYYGNFILLNKNKLFRDNIVVGKGHANLAFFSIWNDIKLLSDKILNSYGKDGGLGGQMDLSIDMVDNITGSLGHAIGIASGIALANKLDKNINKTFAIVGDGEMEEGSIWEAIDFASKYQLNNLICIIDSNKLSVTHTITDDNLRNKLLQYKWNVYSIDGHDYDYIQKSLHLVLRQNNNYPTAIIANTIKGKGISFMENNMSWHHGCPTDEEFDRALLELGGNNE